MVLPTQMILVSYDILQMKHDLLLIFYISHKMQIIFFTHFLKYLLI